jgi:hypothetical protein
VDKTVSKGGLKQSILGRIQKLLDIDSTAEKSVVSTMMSSRPSSQIGRTSGLNFDALMHLAVTGNAQAQHDDGVRLF